MGPEAKEDKNTRMRTLCLEEMGAKVENSSLSATGMSRLEKYYVAR